jgi:hypothetical protein
MLSVASVRVVPTWACDTFTTTSRDRANYPKPPLKIRGTLDYCYPRDDIAPKIAHKGIGGLDPRDFTGEVTYSGDWV